ncbi:MAG: CoA transferase [Chloroflexi bacterium]|nr:CoA transferase [Chloroflexota bacterium]
MSMEPLPAALDGVRVLDLSEEMGAYLGKLLGDMGAEVIKVEPPEGSVLRRRGPFFNGQPNPEGGLPWLFANTSKKGVTLNLRTAGGRELFRRLIPTADVIIEDQAPGTLEGWGLGYDDLAALNAGVVLVRITPFGQTGPYRSFKATDFTVTAMAGPTFLAGEPDRAPLAFPDGQAYYTACAHASYATLLALLDRDFTGLGQQVDVSVQESLMMAQENAMNWFDMRRGLRSRTGAAGFTGARTVFPCADGYVHGAAGNRWDAFVSWMDSKGLAGDLKAPPYQDQAYRQLPGVREHIEELTIAFYATMGKQQIYEEGQARRIRVSPVNTVQDVVENIQLNANEYFVTVEHPALGAAFAYPGRPATLTETPWAIRSAAPQLGEHNASVYGELGLNAEDLAAMRAAGEL